MKLSFALLLSALAAANAFEEPIKYDEANCAQHNKPLDPACETTITTNYALQTKSGRYLSFGESKNIVSQAKEIGLAEELTTEFLEETGVAAIKSVYRDTYLRLKPQAEKVTQSSFVGGWSKVKIVETTASPDKYTEIGIRGVQFDRFLRAPEAESKVVDQVENYLSEEERFVQIPITQCTLETTTGDYIAIKSKPEVTPIVTEDTKYQLIEHQDHVLLRNVVNEKYLSMNPATFQIEENDSKPTKPENQWTIESGTLDTTFALKNINAESYIAVDLKPDAPGEVAEGSEESPIIKAAPEDLTLVPVDEPTETSMLRCEQRAPEEM